MDKNEVLKILETAKDKDGEIPMRLVRQAFEELPEPCENCVSRKDVLSEFCMHCDNEWNCSVEKCYKAEWIRNLPSVQPERPKGHWILVHPLLENDSGTYMCSECRTGDWDIDPVKDKFCKFCGADMKGEQHEAD